MAVSKLYRKNRLSNSWRFVKFDDLLALLLHYRLLTCLRFSSGSCWNSKISGTSQESGLQYIQPDPESMLEGELVLR